MFKIIQVSLSPSAFGVNASFGSIGNRTFTVVIFDAGQPFSFSTVTSYELVSSGLGKRLDSLPYEISFELHTEMAKKAYVSEALVKGKNKREVNELFIKLWKLGYRVISKVLNSGDPACCEFVVERLGSVNNVSDTWRNIVRSSHDVCPARRVWFGPFTKTRSSG